MKRYDPRELEPKWQKIWDDTKLHEATEDSSKPKKYVLDMFPYPSGAGIHVGHIRNYSISDTYGRYQRMTGKNVLRAMGWDAFGLPAENYAIKTGTPPQVSTKTNTDTFQMQLQRMGFAYDWSRTIDSSEPEYYRWTQWFFLLLHKRGLAYQAESLQWWCDKCKTVLANEQVVNGCCWRHEDNPVNKKLTKQWFFKITDYADRLLEDLGELDWPEKIKMMQRNWIGRSVGAEIEFKLNGISGQDDAEHSVTVFTTRADTLAGATFLVVSPELAQTWLSVGWKVSKQVKDYIDTSLKASEIERTDEGNAKTGADAGTTALNPLTGKQIPVWVADYVLGGYGTGAIMAVPAHDQRDFEFATKFKLPVTTVIEPITGTVQENPEHRRSIVAIVEDPDTGKVLSINWGKSAGGNLFIGGGIDGDEDVKTAARREILEETGYKNLKLLATSERIHHHYFAHSKNVARQIEAVGLYFQLEDHERNQQKLEANEEGKFSLEWIDKKDADQLIRDPLHHYVYDKFVLGKVYTGEGVMVNSGVYDGMSSAEAREKITAELGLEKINYKMRDWLISRQRYWGAPIPMVHCSKCGTVPVPEDELPIVLPELKSYEPTGDGKAPLGRATDWVDVSCPVCGGLAERETDTMDGFACSSWYFLRFTDPHNQKAAFDADKADYWLPVDTYVGGAEHAVMHLLYARFWTKVMQDAGLVKFNEPFKSLRNQGLIGAADGRKMSKSLGNVIDPIDVINEGYGADALRMSALFAAPYDQGTVWSPSGVDGTKRFLNRVWALVQEQLAAKSLEPIANSALETALASVTHKTIRKVTADLEHFGFNTAIAAMMELVNEMYKLKSDLPLGSDARRENLKLLIKLLAPFAPHMTEELWHQLGGDESVHVASWPAWDERLVVDELVTVIVQVNGKLRAQLQVQTGAGEKTITDLANANDNVAKFLDGKDIKKVIFVPNKLINFVVR